MDQEDLVVITLDPPSPPPRGPPTRPPPPLSRQVSYFKLFRDADGFDIFLLVIGSIASAGNGLIMPLFTIVLGGSGDIWSAFGAIFSGLRHLWVWGLY